MQSVGASTTLMSCFRRVAMKLYSQIASVASTVVVVKSVGAVRISARHANANKAQTDM